VKNIQFFNFAIQILPKTENIIQKIKGSSGPNLKKLQMSKTRY
jgi:hypothetical protein